MDHFVLAQTGLDDWIQGIIVVLVLAGSALAAISKKLIKKCSPPADGRPRSRYTVVAPQARRSPFA